TTLCRSATLAGCALSGVINPDVVTCTGTASVVRPGVGVGKAVNVTGLTLGGADAGNYALSSTTATTTANITAASVTTSVTASNKNYDKTTSATLVSCTLTGVINPDVVTCTGSAAFATAGVGVGKAVNVTGLTLGGADAGNYALSSTTATTTANITAASVTATVTASNKTYDKTTSATLASCTLSGVIDPDGAPCRGSAAFATPGVGVGKAVNVTGLTLGGADAGNYALSSTTATTTANVTTASVTATVTASNKSYDKTTSATLATC